MSGRRPPQAPATDQHGEHNPDVEEAAALVRHEDLRVVRRRTAGLLRGLAAAREADAWPLLRLRARRLAGFALVGELIVAEAVGDAARVADLEELVRDRAAERRRETAA